MTPRCPSTAFSLTSHFTSTAFSLTPHCLSIQDFNPAPYIECENGAPADFAALFEAGAGSGTTEMIQPCVESTYMPSLWLRSTRLRRLRCGASPFSSRQLLPPPLADWSPAFAS